ncbi:MAG: hypothetical protein M1820_000178 [Bogoriella megaspora]|nr:MAG: hypothetical protein M1820_000178 [Bogoriella megaspora]
MSVKFSVFAFLAASLSVLASPSNTQPSQPATTNGIYLEPLQKNTTKIPVGSTWDIKWENNTLPKDGCPTVSLQLLVNCPNNCIQELEIISAVDSKGGIYQWDVPATLQPDEEGKWEHGFKIICEDTSSYQFSSNFAIVKNNKTSPTTTSTISIETTTTSTSTSTTSSKSDESTSTVTSTISTKTTSTSTSTSTTSTSKHTISGSTVPRSTSIPNSIGSLTAPQSYGPAPTLNGYSSASGNVTAPQSFGPAPTLGGSSSGSSNGTAPTLSSPGSSPTNSPIPANPNGSGSLKVGAATFVLGALAMAAMMM